jgi:hypothetical protein
MSTEVGSDLEQRVQRLEDIEAIKRLQSEYGRCIDRGYDLEGLARLFVEDAVWESNAFGAYQNRQEFLDGQARIAKGVRWGFHSFACNGVDVAADGRQASGNWYLVLFGTFVRKDGTTADPLLITATYDNTFVKLDGEWRFQRMKVHFHQSSDIRKGWIEQPFWNE